MTNLPMIEPFGVLDTFVNGLGAVENLGGGCFRFTFYVIQKTGGREDRIVQAKIIAPGEAIVSAAFMGLDNIGSPLVDEIKDKGIFDHMNHT